MRLDIITLLALHVYHNVLLCDVLLYDMVTNYGRFVEMSVDYCAEHLVVAPVSAPQAPPGLQTTPLHPDLVI